MSPGVNYQEQETDKPKHQEQNGPGLAFPELLETSGHFRKVHAAIIYTNTPLSKRKVLQFPVGLLPAQTLIGQAACRLAGRQARLQTGAGFIDAPGGAFRR